MPDYKSAQIEFKPTPNWDQVCSGILQAGAKALGEAGLSTELAASQVSVGPGTKGFTGL